MKPPRFFPVILVGFALSWVGSASVYKPSVLRELADVIETATPVPVPTAGSIEVGFSPKGGAEILVLRIIDSAKADVKALSYSFTGPRVVVTLLCATKCGVTVSPVVDYRNNVIDDRDGEGRAALPALAEAGCDVRVVSAYPIHHDKVLIASCQTVELGNFNYSNAAARVNSENALMNWNNPALVEAYLAHSDRS